MMFEEINKFAHALFSRQKVLTPNRSRIKGVKVLEASVSGNAPSSNRSLGAKLETKPEARVEVQVETSGSKNPALHGKMKAAIAFRGNSFPASVGKALLKVSLKIPRVYERSPRVSALIRGNDPESPCFKYRSRAIFNYEATGGQVAEHRVNETIWRSLLRSPTIIVGMCAFFGFQAYDSHEDRLRDAQGGPAKIQKEIAIRRAELQPEIETTRANAEIAKTCILKGGSWVSMRTTSGYTCALPGFHFKQ